ncbi:MAG TPA: hypothetical protein VMQ65_06760 [Candidatus Limnocylindria bacterium]|nr:hypothetical protein [Candidatus Limnocylindria bacterium]
MNDDRDIDRLLHEEGARWRSAVAVDRDVADVPFHAGSVHRLIRPTFVAVGSVGVLAAVIVVMVGLRFSALIGPSDDPIAGTQGAGTQPPGSTPQPIDTPWPAVDTSPYVNVVYPGDRVVATGTLATHKGKLYLCPALLLAITGGIGCMGNPLVLVWPTADWDGSSARVEGYWDGESITATTMTGVPPIRLPRPVIPCDPPVGGWPGLATSEAGESAALALQAEVDRHPERYLGLWAASTPDAEGETSNRAAVVGTVDDIQSVTTELVALYPFNLCVVSSDFSAADLLPVVDELEALDYPWQVNLEAQVGRVEVWATALSPAMAEALVRFPDKVVVHTTLRLASSPPIDPEEPLLRVIVAVNSDPINFGGVYLERGGARDGELVIQYVGSNAGRAAVEARITPGLAVRWEKVEYSRGELLRIAREISDLRLAGVFGVSSGTSRNRVIVMVGPSGSVAEVSQVLAPKYGDAVVVEFSADVPVVLPAFESPTP